MGRNVSGKVSLPSIPNREKRVLLLDTDADKQCCDAALIIHEMCIAPNNVQTESFVHELKNR